MLNYDVSCVGRMSCTDWLIELIGFPGLVTINLQASGAASPKKAENQIIK